MENLKKVEQLLHCQFDNVYTCIDDVLFVNLDFLTNRNYQFEGVNEFLYTISQVGKDKTIVFLLRDGVNPYLTSMKLLIEKTIDIHDLNENNCFIVGYYKLNINRTTTIFHEAADIWASQIYPVIKELSISDNSFNLKFAALFGRHDPFRLKICRYLYENFREQSLLSYNAFRTTYNSRFKTYFDDDQSWFETRCPLLLDFDRASGWVPFQDSLNCIHTHYQKYFLEIVVETDPHTDNFFTEKTLKNFYLGKPFLLLSGQGSLKYLHSLGYKTFSPIIDESYDNHPGIADRLDAIFNEITRIAGLSINELADMHVQLMPIFEHNRQWFVKKGQEPVKQKIVKIS